MRKKLLELPTESPQSAALSAKENNIRILILINNIEGIIEGTKIYFFVSIYITKTNDD